MTSSIHADLDGVQRRIEKILGTDTRGSTLDLLHEAWSITIRFMLLYQRQSHLLPDELTRSLYTLTREKLDMADRIGARITQLGGAPDYSADGMIRFEGRRGVQVADYVSWLKDDLSAEQRCTDLWARVAGWVGERDPASQRIFQSAGEAARRHAEAIEALIQKLPR